MYYHFPGNIEAIEFARKRGSRDRKPRKKKGLGTVAKQALGWGAMSAGIGAGVTALGAGIGANETVNEIDIASQFRGNRPATSREKFGAKVKLGREIAKQNYKGIVGKHALIGAGLGAALGAGELNRQRIKDKRKRKKR